MKKTIADADGKFSCPHCGERYGYTPAHPPPHGKIVETVCDGEDGCGETFEVEFPE